MPFWRISVRRAFAITNTYRGLLQVNVELSAPSRCKENALHTLNHMLHSGHFVAKPLSGKGLKGNAGTLPWGLSR